MPDDRAKGHGIWHPQLSVTPKPGVSMLALSKTLRCQMVLLIAITAACSNSANSAGNGDDLGTAAADLGGSLDSAEVNDVATDQEIGVDTSISSDDLADASPAADAADAGTDIAKVDAGCTDSGCSCTDNSQCDSGFCLEVDGAKQCAALCGSGCVPGFHCSQLASSGGDIVNVCTPSFPRLCEPCQADSDCNNVLGGADSRCVSYKDNSGSLLGNFCSTPCVSSADCAAGYGCQATTSLGGIKSNQCVKQDLVCPCDKRAENLGLVTSCTNANAVGACNGKRVCSASGLSTCDALSAQPEACNLIDDDCDGLTDEPSPGLCDDNLACTYDNCIAGECQHPPKTGACDDGSACSSGDECNNGKCVGTAVVCDDKNPCKADSCDPSKGCLNTPSSDASCTDGNACTLGDTCKDGACLPGSGTVCDDQNVCTTDSCDPKQGCLFANNVALCSDGDECTVGDQCKDGLCQGIAKQKCVDGNPCTDDGCDLGQGCKFAPNLLACDDGNLCTVGDACKGGQCSGLMAKTCDDGNVCTTDSCDPVQGCLTVANTAPCSDGDVCTLGDACIGGLCAGGMSLNCEDGNPCTNDSCDANKACQHSANVAACSDGNACTAGDSCVGGACLPGLILACDDANSCTDDSCDLVLGCSHKLNASACSDGSACTLNDACQNGACIAGNKMACNDGNPCTDDSCDASLGCQFKNNTANCDDGNGCTGPDVCDTGKCAAQSGCSANAQCKPGAQATMCICNAGFTGNGFQCVDIDECQNGSANCGANSACVNTPGSFQCVCNAGFADCNKDAKDGCEINTQTDVNNCNACGSGCGSPVNGVAKCETGICKIASCNAGYADCDSTFPDGCEINTKTDINNCSACGKACPANQACNGGVCASANCLKDWLVGTPCNGVNYGNGCQPSETGYHWKGVFQSGGQNYACWWHQKNQAWNTSNASNFWTLAAQFKLPQGQGGAVWCYHFSADPCASGACVNNAGGYFDQNQVGAWGWCAEGDPLNGGFVCIPDPNNYQSCQ